MYIEILSLINVLLNTSRLIYYDFAAGYRENAVLVIHLKNEKHRKYIFIITLALDIINVGTL